MRQNKTNRPIEPIDLDPKIEAVRFQGKDARLGRANRSGRPGTSYGNLVGLENSKAQLTYKMWGSIFGATESIGKAAYKDQQKKALEAEKLKATQEILRRQNQARTDEMQRLTSKLLTNDLSQLAPDVLANPLTPQGAEAYLAMEIAAAEGDDVAFGLSKIEFDKHYIEPIPMPAAGQTTDGLSTDYDYSSVVPTDSMDTVTPEPTGLEEETFNPERWLASQEAPAAPAVQIDVDYGPQKDDGWKRLNDVGIYAPKYNKYHQLFKSMIDTIESQGGRVWNGIAVGAPPPKTHPFYDEYFELLRLFEEEPKQ
jgi:hypothetical protein